MGRVYGYMVKWSSSNIASPPPLAPHGALTDDRRMTSPRESLQSADVASEARRLLAPWFRRRQFERDSFFWHEGDTTGMLVAVVSGHVKAFRTLPGGREVTVYLFGPGDVFGFLPFLDGDPYPLSTRAVDDVEADVLLREELLETVRENPDVAMALLALLGKRLREAFDRVAGSSGGAIPRVAAALVSLIPADHERSTVVIELPVAGHEYAAALGITPESLSRAVSKLVEDGVVRRLGTRKLQVLSVEKLLHCAGRG